MQELKWKKNLRGDYLDKLAEEALSQIDEMGYDSELKEEGIYNILKMGIAFSGKKVSIKAK